ncbi:hypothetical protein [Burkholderia vietnamiensis]|uniref:hypothetical protein n=1 Tax=Burkholderia vietnamiensis TaxID=60552 RepID=UPI0015938009|nr:hypothetical protein [Burkholderia vietnamiensis]
MVKRNDAGRQRSMNNEAQLAAPDAVIECGVADSEAGRGERCETVFDRLEAKYRAMWVKQGGDPA